MWFTLKNLLNHFLLFHAEAVRRKAGEGGKEKGEEIRQHGLTLH